jgi:hypothetical protein
MKTKGCLSASILLMLSLGAALLVAGGPSDAAVAIDPRARSADGRLLRAVAGLFLLAVSAGRLLLCATRDASCAAHIIHTQRDAEVDCLITCN